MIKPPYQRKPVWASRQKCYLIESILMGLPVPEIYVQQTTTPDGETTYAIVDGQQRIRTVLQFVGSETDPDEQEYNKFLLDKLPIGSPWSSKSFGDLTDEEKTRFYGYSFAVRYLQTNSDAEVRDMFERLNRYLTPLKPQELRNARYTGPFVQLTLELADNEFWATNGIVTPALIRRMGDVEFISELLIGVMHGPQGGSPQVIDEYYEQYEDFEDEFPNQRRVKKLFVDTLERIQEVFPEIKKTTRWGNRADFYTLFAAMANLLKAGTLRTGKVPQFRQALEEFAAKVDRRLADEHARVDRSVVEYVRAIEKGVNDKRRRGVRHTVLTDLMKGYFKLTKQAQAQKPK
ncbi:MAG: DUF262 domain-containing protein [Acidobacteria bacterium]|nr:DUF262 domain-containing protein [Acidobacteriota bacterium]